MHGAPESEAIGQMLTCLQLESGGQHCAQSTALSTGRCITCLTLEHGLMTPPGHAWKGHFGLKVYHLPISQGDMVYIEVQSCLSTWQLCKIAGGDPNA